ncbi:hypothetical protein TrRE_jg6813, partial [Triparma retinervis]
ANTKSLDTLQSHLTAMHKGASDLRAVDAVKIVRERLEARKRALEEMIKEIEDTTREVKKVKGIIER